MHKIGESQFVDFFSGQLKDALNLEFGKSAKYSIGNFSGSQDRKFADFFASTDSSNILIEFKEKKSEYTDEKKKPLREKLCFNLDSDTSNISRSCHFIGWGARAQAIRVDLGPYIDIVCPLWGISKNIIHPNEFIHDEFIDCFMQGNVGVSHEAFVWYVDYLNFIAGGSAASGEAPFRSILYSRNDSGRLVGTRFENLNQLNMLRNIKPPAPSSGPSWSGSGPRR